MKTILSVQSHVASGYVGNRAAVFPLQLLGYDVMAVNTVQFSNHTGYGSWTGSVLSADHIRDVLEGLKRNGSLSKCEALLTGYMGSAEIGGILLETLEDMAPGALWLCDPVMGDVGRGFFVPDSQPPFFKDSALPRAGIVTPNQFELEYLSGRDIKTLDDALSACAALHEAGPEVVLVTSLYHDTLPEDRIALLASRKDGARFLATTPLLPLHPAPNGAGDCTAALFLGHYLKNRDMQAALDATARSVYALFSETQVRKSRELALIPARDAFITPPENVDITVEGF